MPLPTRPAYLVYVNSDGTPEKGYIEFTMSNDIVVNGVGIVHVDTVRRYLDVNGRVDVDLIVTDSPAVSPVGLYWLIEEKIPNGNVWYTEVPIGDGSPLNLAPFYVPGIEPPAIVVSVKDHGILTGLADDDHPQYLTKARGDTIYAPLSSAGGITKRVEVITFNTTAGSLPKTWYVYKCVGPLTLTMPTAVGNDNVYTIKLSGIGSVIITTQDSQTIDGSLNFIISTNYMSIDLTSDGSNWMVV